MIFRKADNNNSGTLNLKDFQEVIADICERYPQVGLYLKMKQMKTISDLLKKSQDDTQGTELDIKLFTSALCEVDSQVKNLPATAQVKKFRSNSSSSSIFLQSSRTFLPFYPFR